MGSMANFSPVAVWLPPLGNTAFSLESAMAKRVFFEAHSFSCVSKRICNHSGSELFGEQFCEPI